MNTDRVYSAFLHVAVVVLIVLVAILAFQNRDLKRGFGPQALSGIEVGGTFRFDSLLHVAGTPSAPMRPGSSVVFVLTTSCPFCKLNVPKWNSLSDQAAERMRIVGVCMDSDSAAQQFVQSYSVRFPVFVPANKEHFRTANKILGVPLTLIVDETFQVARKWEGELTMRGFEEVSAAIHQLALHD